MHSPRLSTHHDHPWLRWWPATHLKNTGNHLACNLPSTVPTLQLRVFSFPFINNGGQRGCQFQRTMYHQFSGGKQSMFAFRQGRRLVLKPWVSPTWNSTAFPGAWHQENNKSNRRKYSGYNAFWKN